MEGRWPVKKTWTWDIRCSTPGKCRKHRPCASLWTRAQDTNTGHCKRFCKIRPEALENIGTILPRFQGIGSSIDYIQVNKRVSWSVEGCCNRFGFKYNLIIGVLLIWLSAHQQAHDRAKILHHNISVGNIIITDEGRRLLIDWELASSIEDGPKLPEITVRTKCWLHESAIIAHFLPYSIGYLPIPCCLICLRHPTLAGWTAQSAGWHWVHVPCTSMGDPLLH